MSVYRILDFLEENGLIHRLNTTKKYIACSHIACEHPHEAPQFLICKSCSKVEEVSIPKPAVAMVGKATQTAGFDWSAINWKSSALYRLSGDRPSSDELHHNG